MIHNDTMTLKKCIELNIHAINMVQTTFVTWYTNTHRSDNVFNVICKITSIQMLCSTSSSSLADTANSANVIQISNDKSWQWINKGDNILSLNSTCSHYLQIDHNMNCINSYWNVFKKKFLLKPVVDVSVKKMKGCIGNKWMSSHLSVYWICSRHKRLSIPLFILNVQTYIKLNRNIQLMN